MTGNVAWDSGSVYDPESSCVKNTEKHKVDIVIVNIRGYINYLESSTHRSLESRTADGSFKVPIRQDPNS